MKDGLGRVDSVLVLGGTSEIGLATARALVAAGTRRVILAGRNSRSLEEAAAAFGATPAQVSIEAFDATAVAEHEQIIDALFDRHGDVDVVLLAFGVLGDPAESGENHDLAVEIVTTNGLGVVSVSIPLARRLRQQGHGTLVLLSSAGATRVRASTRVYGASKAAIDAYGLALRDSLHGSGVEVLVVRPGHVRTRMTAGLPEPPLTTTPEAVAEAILGGLRRGVATVWVPPMMQVAMLGLRVLPRALFRRLPI